MFRKLIPLVLVLGISLSACNFHISLPITQKVGPTVTDTIVLPVSADTTRTVDLSLSFGAGTLKLHPGTDALVAGTATYNIPDFKPVVTQDGSTASIEQGNWRLTGIPDLGNLENEWDFSLGTLPMNLTIDGGAYKAEYEFGGLALANLTVSDGAADVNLNFASSNLTGMSLLSYSTGASNVSLTGLANANFTSMELDCGAGNFTLDFSGNLQHNASVSIETGVSNTTLVIPNGIPAQVTVEGGLSNVTYSGDWSHTNNLYTQEGQGPALTIVVKMGAGNLTLTK